MHIGYTRVSTREQAENSHSLEQHVQRLRAAGAEEIITDVETGRHTDRDGFKELMRRVRAGTVTRITVTELSRLGRSLPDLRRAIDEIQACKVSFQSLAENIDLDTSIGRFQLNLAGALAEMESDRLAERVRHGWEHLRQRRVAMNPPFGYTKIDNRHHLDHQPFLCLLQSRQAMSRAEIAADIIEMFFEAKTVRGTVRALNTKYGLFSPSHGRGRFARHLFRFSAGGLHTWLNSPVLRGHLCYLKKRNGKRLNPEDWEITPNTHPDQTLLTEEQYQQMQALLASARQQRGYGSTAPKYPLSGLIFCGECQATCYSISASRGRNMPGRNYYYQCRNWTSRACNQSRMVRMDVLERLAIEALTQRAEAIANLVTEPSQPLESPELRELRVQLAGLEALGYNPALEQAKRDLAAQIDVLCLREQSEDRTQAVKEQLLVHTFRDPCYWETLTALERRELYRALIKRIVVRDGTVESLELNV